MKLIKKLRILLFAALMLALLPPAVSGLTPIKAAAESANLLKNPGFSGGLTYWTHSWGNGGSDACDSSVSHTADGSGSLKITGEESINRTRGQEITLTAGKKYLVSGYIKIEKMTHSGAANCGAYFSFGDVVGYATGKMDGSAVEEDWTLYQTEFVPTETASYTLECRLWGASGTVWFDDLSIAEVEEETPQPVPEAPAPDKTFVPVAVKAVKKTGLYTDFSTMNVVGALAKNVYVVADGVKTVNGTEYRRVTAYFGGKSQIGYVKSSDLTADDSLNVATINKSAPAKTQDGSIYTTLSAGDKIVCVQKATGSVMTNADSRYNVLHKVSSSFLTVSSGGTLVDMYTLNVSVKNPSCGKVNGITAGKSEVASGTVLTFTVTANDGYAFRLAEEGGIFTKGNNSFALTMTGNATVSVEFYPILREELIPGFAAGQTPAFNGSWTDGITKTSTVSGAPDGVSGDAFRLTNTEQTHATFNYTVALKPYATYRLTVWLRFDLDAADAGGCGTWIQVSGSGIGFRLGREFRGAESSDWTKYEHEFTVAGEEVAAVAFQLWGASGYTEFAGVSLMAVSKTTFTKTYKAGTGGSVSTEKVTGTYGETFQVLACPIPGYEFVSWSDGVTTAYRTEKMDKNETLTATFRKVETQSAKMADEVVLQQAEGETHSCEAAAPSAADVSAQNGADNAGADLPLPAFPEEAPVSDKRMVKNVVFPKKTVLAAEEVSE